MDLAKTRLSFIGVLIAALLVAFLGIFALVGLGNVADTAQADPLPHVHDDVTFEPWSSATSLPDTAGNWYLTKDVTISSTWSVPSGTTNLCLNGHGIKMTGNNSVVTVSTGAKLKLYDCDTTTVHKYSVSDAKSNGAGFATVNDALTSGYRTFIGGYITGGKGTPVNSWSRGGAFYIEGAVEMYGGTIIGNGQYDVTHGGGFNTQGSGTFKMYGGSIQNNAGKCGGATRLQGSGSCEIYGGKIINNIVGADGGGIHVGGSISLILKDCEISGNYAGNGPGAGIWMTTTGTVISGRTIITNNLTNSGASNVEIGNGYVIGVGELTDGATIGIMMQSGTGVFTSGWSDKMKGKDPADYFFIEDDSYSIGSTPAGEAVIGTAFEVSFVANGHGVAPDRQSVVSGCLIQEPAALTDDVYTFAGWYKEAGLVNEWAFDVDTVSVDTTLYAKWTFVYNNTTFDAWTETDSLPANGNYYLTDNVTVGDQTVVPSGNVVNLCLNGHSVTNAVSRIYLVNDGGTLHVYDNVGSGSMRGEKRNKNYDSVGTVVRVAKGGYFELHSGTLYGSSTSGNGFFTVLTYGEFTMSGGMITEEQDQFGVQAEGAESVFRMTGGVITNCKGGGVHVYGGTAYISGGTISDNGENRAFGGVLLLSDYATSALFLSGNPTIVNNTNNQGVACNVNLYGTKTITIDGALTNTTPIGITRSQGIFANGWTEAMGEADPADYFTSDNANYAIGLADGEATLLLSMTATAQAYNGDYDGDAHGITVAPSVEGATIKYGTSANDCTLDALTYTGAGAYTVYYLVTKSGYASVRGSATVTIAKKKLTVTAHDQSKTYGDADPTLTYTAVGLLGTDALSGELIRDAGENVGTYDITQGTLTAGGNYEISFNGALLTITQKAEAKVEVKTEGGEGEIAVAVDGLDKEMQAIKESDPTAGEISVVMTVEHVSEEEIAEEPEESHAKIIQNTAQEKNFEFFEIKVEKTVDSVKTLLSETSNVLEIAIPFTKAHKRGLTVCSYHGDEVMTFIESDNKEVGTFRVDKVNKIVYVYTKTFSTYAIGYTPYYRVATAVDLGNYTGNADVTLVNRADGTTYSQEDVDPANIVFADVPKGQYVLTVTWTDGAENTISMPMAVGYKAVIPLPEEEPEEEEAEAAAAEDVPFDDPFEEMADDLNDVVLEDRRYVEEIFALTKRNNDRDDA